jgi:alkaline phosphatase D
MPVFRSPLLARRRFLAGSAALGLAGSFPRPALAQAGRPVITHGITSGDVTSSGAVVWARADRPARMVVDWSTTPSFREMTRVEGPAALEPGDFTARVVLDGLPAGQDIVYRVQFQDLADVNVWSLPELGRLRTAPMGLADVSFVWTADTCGQGWGINPDWGGLRGYEAMREAEPDFLIHSGDTIYADNPIPAEVPLPDGTLWRNHVTPETSKVAETLEEFRGRFKYNLLDENVRRFNAEVPVFAQWDDHEVLNNWYPQEVLASDDRYRVKSVALLAARARRAFLDYMPLAPQPGDPERIYRRIGYGPRLDVFFLDMRSHRAANGANRQTAMGPDTAFLGARQVAWLKGALMASRATWKVIAADMPIGIVVGDGEGAFENAANGDGEALGRELEIAGLLAFIRHAGVRNTVWLTGDVHYTAAHRYDPARARFKDFDPFWEFVSGPIHAGSFGPGVMDDTFGPQVVFSKSPEGVPNLPPSAGLQFFGHVRIAGATGVMTVSLKNIAGETLYSVDLEPA